MYFNYRFLQPWVVEVFGGVGERSLMAFSLRHHAWTTRQHQVSCQSFWEFVKVVDRTIEHNWKLWLWFWLPNCMQLQWEQKFTRCRFYSFLDIFETTHHLLVEGGTRGCKHFWKLVSTELVKPFFDSVPWWYWMILPHIFSFWRAKRPCRWFKVSFHPLCPLALSTLPCSPENSKFIIKRGEIFALPWSVGSGGNYSSTSNFTLPRATVTWLYRVVSLVSSTRIPISVRY